MVSVRTITTLCLFTLAVAAASRCASAAHASAGPFTAPSTTLEKITAAGKLSCGIDIEEPEYTLADAHGNHAPFDADI